MKAGSKRPKQDAPAEVESPDDPELPPTWCLSNLAALTDPKRPICYGILMPKENVADGVPYVEVKDIKAGRVDLASIHRAAPEIAAKYERSTLRPGDLLLSIRGTNGRVALVPQELDRGNVSRDIARVAILPVVDARFIAYQLRSISAQNYYQRVARGVAVKGVNIADVKLTPIRLAPLLEQRRIVATIEEHLTRLDAGIAALVSARARLRRYRASVLKAACEGSLVPTEAELARAEGRDYEPADRLLARILQHRRSRWESDQLAKLHAQGKPPKDDRWKARYAEPAPPDVADLPPLPEGWTVASMDQLTSHITSGSRDWTKFYGEGSGTFLMAQNVRMGRLDLSFRQPVNPPANDRDRVRSQVEPDDLLVTIVGASTGFICKVPRELPEHYVCQSVALMRPVDRELADFVTLYMTSDENGQRQYARYIYGAGRPHLSFEQLKMTAVLVPPLAEQHHIVAEVERRLSLVDGLDAALATGLKRAERLRQAILKRAFAGRLVPQDPADEPASALLERLRSGPDRSHGKSSSRSATPSPGAFDRTSRKSTSRTEQSAPEGRDQQPTLFD